eukprot:3724601-Amphidinium_carterae.1
MQWQLQNKSNVQRWQTPTQNRITSQHYDKLETQVGIKRGGDATTWGARHVHVQALCFQQVLHCPRVMLLVQFGIFSNEHGIGGNLDN